jgi:hypothetical protein
MLFDERPDLEQFALPSDGIPGGGCIQLGHHQVAERRVVESV